MKVAVYSGNIPSTTFIENLIDGLSKAGFEINLFGKKSADVIARENVNIYPTPVSKSGLIFFVISQSVKLAIKDPVKFGKCIRTVFKHKGNFKAVMSELGILLPMLNNASDIFHIQWGKTIHRHPEIFELLDGKFALSLRGAHINYSPLNDHGLADSYRKYFPSISGFHAVSEAIAKEAQKYGATEGKISVIHSSVKDDLFNKSAKDFESGSRLEIISIGRFHWKKGYVYALDAMKILSDKEIDFVYTIVAQGKIPEEIIFLIEEYGLNEKVKIINGLSYDELMKKLLESHLFLLPSVEEGIANVVLEAMAVGVAVITTDCGGMNEVVKDGENGYLINVRRPDQIAERIFEFLKTDSLQRRRNSEAAKQFILKEFNSKKQVSEFSDFYNSIVSQ